MIVHNHLNAEQVPTEHAKMTKQMYGAFELFRVSNIGAISRGIQNRVKYLKKAVVFMRMPLGMCTAEHFYDIVTFSKYHRLTVILEVGANLTALLLAAKFTDGYLWRQSNTLMLARGSRVWEI